MHILYFHQHFSTPLGAAGTRSYEMAQALLRHGHQVTMVCGSYAQGNSGLSSSFAKGQRRGRVDGIDVIEFDLNYSNDMGFLTRTLVFLKFALGSIAVAMKEKADVIFATSTPLTAGIPGIFARWFKGKPFVFEVRDLWPELPREMGIIKNPLILWAMAVLEWISYKSAHRLIGLSPGIVDGIARHKIDRNRIKFIPNGCDLDLFSKDSTRKRPENVDDNQLLAVFTGTHGNANDLGAVLDVANVLKRRNRRDITIALIGQGGEKQALTERAKKEGISNVLFLDPVPKTELTNLMRGADIGLQTLRNVPAFYYGTSPNKFFDYIAAGLPVLNNYPGWLAELIDAHDCGYSVPPDDPIAFADALIHASENRALLKAKGQNSRALAKEKFARHDLSNAWVAWVSGAAKNRTPL